MSPPIHERLFVLGKQQAEYEVLQTPPEQFEALWPYLRQLDGFNITIPYKQQIIPFCARLDDTAKRYGAVNVVDGKNGGTGYNTDCVGFLRSLEGIPLQEEVLIAGAGGVGRMFSGLLLAGISPGKGGARAQQRPAARPVLSAAAKGLPGLPQAGQRRVPFLDDQRCQTDRAAGLEPLF